jgi:hypothetical protein
MKIVFSSVQKLSKFSSISKKRREPMTINYFHNFDNEFLNKYEKSKKLKHL